MSCQRKSGGVQPKFLAYTRPFVGRRDPVLCDSSVLLRFHCTILHFSFVAAMYNLMTKSFLDLQDAMKEKEAAAIAEEDVVEIETWNPEESLRPFLNEALLVNEEMDSILNLLAHLKAANNDSKLAHKQDLRLALRDRINSQISKILNTTRRNCKLLEVMDCANAENRCISSYGEGTTVDWARIYVTNWLCKMLKKRMMDFQ
ncbi:uncharacterized protein LOC110030232 [Phalaenopsis equestris]|uniref:uncharacterized protein LOC110030232 n=1 Tax=Phalaenopsis equestris TaxID=78828 RepID=UPI0009E6373E|nr:uncharacterized protein LOC110030232 [Phalaenopsis equestris]